MHPGVETRGRAGAHAPLMNVKYPLIFFEIQMIFENLPLLAPITLKELNSWLRLACTTPSMSPPSSY
jgi:hypothetical protein